jgi:CheY-like chemotaxis protein
VGYRTFVARVLISPMMSTTVDLAEVSAITPGSQNLPFREALAGMSVLIVDDHEDMRDLLSIVLRAHGIVVHPADGASAALSLLSTVHVDLIISDIGMPGQDGYSFIRAVRALPGDTARIPAIALTAFGLAEDRSRALRAGFNAHLTKPAESAALIRAVADLGGRMAPPPSSA